MLDIRLKLFGEEYSRTADSYHSFSVTQLAQSDFTSALQSAQRALDIRLKLFGEEHQAQLTVTIHSGLHNTNKAILSLQSKQRALDIRLRLFAEED